MAERAVRRLMSALADDLVETSRARIAAADLHDVAGVRAHRGGLIAPSPSTRHAKETLEAWLFANLYRHWSVNQTFHAARTMLERLFAFFLAHPDALPTDHGARCDRDGTPRVVADYLAGMTDRFAIDEFRRLCP